MDDEFTHRRNMNTFLLWLGWDHQVYHGYWFSNGRRYSGGLIQKQCEISVVIILKELTLKRDYLLEHAD